MCQILPPCSPASVEGKVGPMLQSCSLPLLHARVLPAHACMLRRPASTSSPWVLMSLMSSSTPCILLAVYPASQMLYPASTAPCLSSLPERVEGGQKAVVSNLAEDGAQFVTVAASLVSALPPRPKSTGLCSQRPPLYRCLQTPIQCFRCRLLSKGPVEPKLSTHLDC